MVEDNFIKNSFLYIVGSLLVGILGYFFHFLVSKRLSISEYGELQSLLAVYSILGVFGSALSYFVTKHASVFAKFKDYGANKEFISFVIKKSVKITFLLLLLFLLILPWIHNVLHLSGFLGLFYVILATCFGFILSIYLADLSAFEEFSLFIIISFAAALFKLICGVFFASIFARAEYVAISFIISSLISLFIAEQLTYQKIFKKHSETPKKLWKEYFSDVDFNKIILPTFLFSVLFVFIMNIDVILVKNITTAEITGYYGALSLLGKIIFWINSAIIAVTLPKAYAEGNEGRRPNGKIILRTYTSIIFIGVIGIFLSMFWSKLIIGYVFGSQYLVVASMLWLFSGISLALSLFSFEANLSYARHDFRISYVLAAIVLAMISGINYFHHTIQEIALVINIIFVLGYVVTLTMNLLSYNYIRSKLDNSIA